MLNFVGKDLLSRLQARFLLREESPRVGSVKILDTLQPVSDVNDLVSIPAIKRNDIAIDTAAAAWVVVATVPQGKRWTLLNAHCFRAIGTVNTFDKFAINDGHDRMEIKSLTATSNNQSEFTQRHLMGSGWRLEIEVAVGEASSTFGARIEVLEEDWS